MTVACFLSPAAEQDVDEVVLFAVTQSNGYNIHINRTTNYSVISIAA